MKANEFLNASLLDILFEQKNKAYGAYQLRATYNKRLTTALTATIFLSLLLAAFHLFANKHKRPITVIPVNDVTIASVEPEKPKALPVKLPKQQTRQVASTQFTTINIVKDVIVKEPMPQVEELVNTRIDVIDRVGETDDSFVAPPIESAGTGTLAIKTNEQDYDVLFTKVEKEAQYPGGLQAWKRYLERNLNAGIAADNGATAGLYSVRVQFVVDKDGRISMVTVVDAPKDCPDCGEEAVRVIKKKRQLATCFSKWKSGEISGNTNDNFPGSGLVIKLQCPGWCQDVAVVLSIYSDC